jgi:hypothetical protein
LLKLAGVDAPPAARWVRAWLLAEGAVGGAAGAPAAEGELAAGASLAEAAGFLGPTAVCA